MTQRERMSLIMISLWVLFVPLGCASQEEVDVIESSSHEEYLAEHPRPTAASSGRSVSTGRSAARRPIPESRPYRPVQTRRPDRPSRSSHGSTHGVVRHHAEATARGRFLRTMIEKLMDVGLPTSDYEVRSGTESSLRYAQGRLTIIGDFSSRTSADHLTKQRDQVFNTIAEMADLGLPVRSFAFEGGQKIGYKNGHLSGPLL